MCLWKIFKIVMPSATLIIGIIFSACSIGASRGYCEKHGCNYREAGVCQSAFDVLSHREETLEKTYKGIVCKNN